jgi:hypothetical protein
VKNYTEIKRQRDKEIMAVIRELSPDLAKATQIVVRYARKHEYFSSNGTRMLMNRAEVPEPYRGRAFQVAQQHSWLVATDETEVSNAPASRKSRVRVWHSLVFDPYLVN